MFSHGYDVTMMYDDVIAENYEVCDNFQDKSSGFYGQSPTQSFKR